MLCQYVEVDKHISQRTKSSRETVEMAINGLSRTVCQGDPGNSGYVIFVFSLRSLGDQPLTDTEGRVQLEEIV